MNIKECEDRHRQNISCGKCPLMIKGSDCRINDIIRSRFDCPFVWGKSNKNNKQYKHLNFTAMIKVIANKSKREPSPGFPKLMINDECIILAIGIDSVSGSLRGTCICNSENPEEVGAYCETWRSDVFEDYNESVILKNEMQLPDQSERHE